MLFAEAQTWGPLTSGLHDTGGSSSLFGARMLRAPNVLLQALLLPLLHTPLPFFIFWAHWCFRKASYNILTLASNWNSSGFISSQRFLCQHWELGFSCFLLTYTLGRLWQHPLGSVSEMDGFRCVNWKKKHQARQTWTHSFCFSWCIVPTYSLGSAVDHLLHFQVLWNKSHYSQAHKLNHYK